MRESIRARIREGLRRRQPAFTIVGGGIYTALALEALISGFYVVITRSLAPIFFAVYGMSMTEIVGLNLLANVVALAMALAIYNFSKTFVLGNTKLKLVLAHGIERVCWGMIPVAAFFYPKLLPLVYTLAVTATVPTGILINVAIFNLPEDRVKKLMAHRNALGAVSSVIGQLTMIAALALISTKLKYLYLYLLASSVGLMATILMGVTPIPRVERLELGAEQEALVKASSSFLFFTSFLASGAILGVVWAPHLIKDLHAPDYIAASIGFIQTITSIGASIFWQGKDYRMYRAAVAGVALSPLLIMLVPSAYAQLGIAALYAFTNTGANFLASFIFADISRRISFFRASTMLTSAWILSQVWGLGISYLLLVLGVPIYGVFAACMGFIAIATFIALTALPEVAVVPPHISNAYARQLHNLAISSYSYVMFTVKSYAVLTLRLLALALAILLLFIIYRVAYYIAVLSG